MDLFKALPRIMHFYYISFPIPQTLIFCSSSAAFAQQHHAHGTSISKASLRACVQCQSMKSAHPAEGSRG
jgi:hypothetical protein